MAIDTPLLDIKFKQSDTYTFEMLVRDMIDFAQQLNDRLEEINTKLEDLDARVTALEP